jgi:hypothetical protein
MTAVLAACAALIACDESTTEPVDPPATATLTVDASAGWVYVDLTDEPAVVAAADPAASTTWDIAFQTTAVKLNGGASGPGAVAGYCVCGNAGATAEALMAMTPASEQGDFEAVTVASLPSSGSWIEDAAEPGGVFQQSPWYRYNLTGQDHQVWPTYDVYLIRAGGEVYKVQIIGYYGQTGDPRQITFRSARLDG